MIMKTGTGINLSLAAVVPGRLTAMAPEAVMVMMNFRADKGREIEMTGMKTMRDKGGNG